MAPKILVVLTSHDKLGDLDKKTGWYLPELAHPYYKFLDAKAELTFASPKGGEAPLDPGSADAFKDDEECKRFLAEDPAPWKTTRKLSEFTGKADDFDAIFYVGGHGPLFDLVSSSDSQSLIRDFYDSKKVVSAVCHGPIVFADVKLADGSYLVDGQEVTGFTNEEEDAIGMTEHVPLLLETRLPERGATFSKADKAWGVKVVKSGEGGRLLTGQNPASAGPLADAILAAL